MVTQEEIRKLVEEYISLAYWYEGQKNVVESLTKALIKKLDKKGVVVKVEDWLPVRSGMTCTVEPLIGGE